MKTLVLSGINIFSGGTLTIYRSCIEQLIEDKVYEKYKIIAFVYKKDLFREYTDYIDFIELPKARNNYLFKIFYEYIYYFFFSLKLDIEYWFSINDVSPNVKAKNKFVYCHNPTPFYSFSIKEFLLDKKMILFSLLYKHLYRINIKKNKYVIVQQQWIRDKFKEYYKIDNVIVANPDVSIISFDDNTDVYEKDVNSKTLFIYPSFPRVFKNFEVICRAAKVLEEKGINYFEIILTIDGTENNYAKYIVEKYNYLETINFTGLLNKETLYSYYNKSHCLLFPSKLETWGLPITEYKDFNKPMLIADLDYAKETLNNYNMVKFFKADDYNELATLMEKYIDNNLVWEKNNYDKKPNFNSWKNLNSFLFNLNS